jgi:hypothetical protein
MKKFTKVTYEQIKRLLILEDYAPCDGGYNKEDRYYRWYAVKNQKEFDLLCDVYDNNELYAPNNYPEIVCVQSEYNPVKTDSNPYGSLGVQTLSNCTDYIKELYGKLGFSVEIK